eukprot:scaffold1499_cov255-Pinguiococcus_pyrenoidosus.AAC.20
MLQARAQRVVQNRGGIEERAQVDEAPEIPASAASRCQGHHDGRLVAFRRIEMGNREQKQMLRRLVLG